MRKGSPDLPRGVDPVEFRKANIHQNQIWIQLPRPLNRLQSVRGLIDFPKFGFFMKQRRNEDTKRGEVFYHENAVYRLQLRCADSPLSVQTRSARGQLLTLYRNPKAHPSRRQQV